MKTNKRCKPGHRLCRSRNDDNRWIVSSYGFLEHRSPRIAEHERQRLSDNFPNKSFRLYRIKRVVDGPEHHRAPQRLLARIIYSMLARVDQWT